MKVRAFTLGKEAVFPLPRCFYGDGYHICLQEHLPYWCWKLRPDDKLPTELIVHKVRAAGIQVRVFRKIGMFGQALCEAAVSLYLVLLQG